MIRHEEIYNGTTSALSPSEALQWFHIKSTEKSWSQASRYKLDLIKLFSSTLCPGDSHFGNLPPNPPQHPLCNVLHILQHQLLRSEERRVGKEVRYWV